MKNLNSILKLLEDTNPAVSSAAMNGLLSLEENGKTEELRKVLASLQESDNPKLRRTAHQLQSVCATRTRHRVFREKLNSTLSPLEMLEMLTRLNDILYDELPSVNSTRLWQDFLKKIKKNKPRNAQELSQELSNSGLSVISGSMKDIDYYCIASVMEESTGYSVILASLALAAATVCGLRAEIISRNICFSQEQFGIQIHLPDSEEKAFIFPDSAWELQQEVFDDIEIWKPEEVVKYVAAMVFSLAVCTEGARFVQVLGSCLAERPATASLEDILPPPYGLSDNRTIKKETTDD